ncbi:MAG: TlpA family protein disulfide reductase [Phycisphaerales bacterium]|jgi:thiol-disulfide isomerase/thioredoxin
MKSALVALKIAAIPMIAVVYVAAMGMTGTCATCESMVDWTLGRSASASGDAGSAGSGGVATAADATAPATRIDPASLGPVFRLDMPDLAGGAVPLSEYAGRPMLIEVWATWCGPCRRLRSVLTAAAPRLAEQGTLVAVSVDQGGAAAVKRHLGDTETPFVELLSTPEFRAALAPHNPGNTIPKLVYVDASGNIAGIELGMADPAWVEARLKALR